MRWYFGKMKLEISCGPYELSSGRYVHRAGPHCIQVGIVFVQLVQLVIAGLVLTVVDLALPRTDSVSDF